MTLSLGQFVDKYNGRPISGYSASGGQCVDAMRQLMREVFGWSRDRVYEAVPGGDAETWFHRASDRDFYRIRNTPSGVPRHLDIVVLLHGTYGHVFVNTDHSDAHKINGWGQNWTLYRKCAAEAHGYDGCVGWLRKR